MKTYRQFQENVATYVLGKTSRNILPKLMVGAGLAGTYLQSKGKFGKDAPQTRKGLKNIVKNVDKNKLEPDTASDREELIAKSDPNLKKLDKIDKAQDNLLDKIRNRGKGPFADTPSAEELRKAKLTGKSPLTKAEKKNRKLSAQREMIQKRDDELMTKGPGDPVPGAKRAYLKKLLNRLKNNLKPSNGLKESRASETTTRTKGGRVVSISKKDIGTTDQYNRDVINKLPSLGGEKIQVDAGGKVPDVGKFYSDISKRYTGRKLDQNKINRNIPGTRANDLKNIEQDINKTFESKITSSPYINKETGIEDKNWDGTVKAGPTIHFGGKRKGKYPNNILDLKDDDPLKKQYFNEPETKEYFKNNPTIKMKFYGEDEPRTYTNPYKKKGTSALESKPGQMPAG